MACANVIAPPFSLILGCLMNGHTRLFNLEKKIKSKPFSVLAASNVIGALRRLFTETRMVLTARIANGFTFSIKTRKCYLFSS